MLAFGVFGLSCIVYSFTVFPLIRLSSTDEDSMRKRIRSVIHRYFRGFVRAISAMGIISCELYGQEKLLRSGQLIVANHPSLIDVLLIIALMPDVDVDCIVKSALVRNPVLRWPISWARYIPSGDPQKLIDDCVRSLRSGRSLIVFPEGTRSTPAQAPLLRRGAARIALGAGCNVVMIGITCRPSAFTKTDSWYRVPLRRPHFCLRIADLIRPAELEHFHGHPTEAARRLTQCFLEYFDSHVRTSAEDEQAADHESRKSVPANPLSDRTAGTRLPLR